MKSYTFQLSKYHHCLDDLAFEYSELERCNMEEVLVVQNDCSVRFTLQVVADLKSQGLRVALNSWDKWQ